MYISNVKLHCLNSLPTIHSLFGILLQININYYDKDVIDEM